MNASQHELIARAVAGDSRAYQALLIDLEPMLRRVIGARLRGRGDLSAEDVLQDVRIYLLQRLDRYNPAYPLGVFARALAHNIIKRHVYKQPDLLPASEAEDWNDDLSPLELQSLPLKFRQVLGDGRFAESEPEPPSRLFTETLALFFRHGGYPHQQIAFGFSILVWGRDKKASHAAKRFEKVPVTGDPGRVVTKVGPRPLKPAADDLITTIGSDCQLEPQFMVRVSRPLSERLQLKLAALFAADRTSRTRFATLLERHAGDTLLREYFGKDGRKSVSDWTLTVKRRIQAAITGTSDSRGRGAEVEK